jgi:hypothetical protein
MIPQDSVPSTLERAVEIIAASLDGQERTAIRELDDDGMLQFGYGRFIRNSWSLWETDSPLKREAVASYRIAHADDISQLILAWVFAKVRDQQFDPVAYCQRFHDHWEKFGTTSLKAGGWDAQS